LNHDAVLTVWRAVMGPATHKYVKGANGHVGPASPYRRFRIFFTVAFKDSEKQRRALKELKRIGRTVDVVKDNVRVRNRPGDGLVLGKVSSHHQVTLIKHRDEWCRVITPNNHQGWMICDALAL
jgi:hypothetical protein